MIIITTTKRILPYRIDDNILWINICLIYSILIILSITNSNDSVIVVVVGVWFEITIYYCYLRKYICRKYWIDWWNSSSIVGRSSGEVIWRIQCHWTSHSCSRRYVGTFPLVYPVSIYIYRYLHYLQKENQCKTYILSK